MNILYITHCDPRDTSFGSAQRSHYLWQALKQIGTVYTVYNVGAKSEFPCDEDNRIWTANLSPDGFFKLRLFARFNNLFAPFVWPFRSSRILRRKMPWKSIRFDRVVVRYLGNVALTNAWIFGDVYVDIDDLPIESFNTIRRNRFMPPFGWLGSKLVSWWQCNVLRKCKASWIASPDQVDMVSAICPCVALPNLPMPPAADYKISGNQKLQLMTVGLMSYEPNYEGVDWFLNNVWLEVKNKFPDMTYKICGRGAPDCLASKWAQLPGVEVLGFVENIDKIYEESLAVVTPIWAGAGTCIKVPEAALHGRKIFATPFAVRGLPSKAVHDLGISVSENSKGMSTALAEWLEYTEAERDMEQSAIECKSRTLYSVGSMYKTVEMTIEQVTLGINE